MVSGTALTTMVKCVQMTPLMYFIVQSQTEVCIVQNGIRTTMEAGTIMMKMQSV